VADEAKVVGIARAYWAAACSRCDWIYRGKSREVDMAARGHCRVCGGDVVAMDMAKEVVLRLERDVRGRVIAGSPTTELNVEPEVIEDPQEAMRAYGEKIRKPEYWKARRGLSGYEESD
jgi:hypothetical protein